MYLNDDDFMFNFIEYFSQFTGLLPLSACQVATATAAAAATTSS